MTETQQATSTERRQEYEKYLSSKHLQDREYLQRIHNKGSKRVTLLDLQQKISNINVDESELEGSLDWFLTFSPAGISVIPLDKKQVSKPSIKRDDGSFLIGPLRQDDPASRAVPVTFMESVLIRFLERNGYRNTENLRKSILLNLHKGSGDQWFVRVTVGHN